MLQGPTGSKFSGASAGERYHPAAFSIQEVSVAEHSYLQHFDEVHHAHLSGLAGDVADHFDAFANKIHNLLPDNDFREKVLEELLDAKDDAVRSALHR
jgi:hypothetical protein